MNRQIKEKKGNSSSSNIRSNATRVPNVDTDYRTLRRNIIVQQSERFIG